LALRIAKGKDGCLRANDAHRGNQQTSTRAIAKSLLQTRRNEPRQLEQLRAPGAPVLGPIP